MQTVTIQYRFRFPDNREEVFDLRFDAETLDLLGDAPDGLPFWTRLDHQQCPNCPLTPETHPHCPTAVHLVRIVSSCRNVLSYEEVHVDVVTPERLVSKDTSAQKGISSLMGLVMATSGCPLTGFFKPMARFHLPLASGKETVYRAASMYLLAQYFLHQAGRPADLSLKGLLKIYYDLQVMNRAMAERLRSASDRDAAVNAVVLLDLYAKTLPLAIEESLKGIRHLFAAYLPPP